MHISKKGTIDQLKVCIEKKFEGITLERDEAVELDACTLIPLNIHQDWVDLRALANLVRANGGELVTHNDNHDLLVLYIKYRYTGSSEELYTGRFDWIRHAFCRNKYVATLYQIAANLIYFLANAYLLLFGLFGLYYELSCTI